MKSSPAQSVFVLANFGFGYEWNLSLTHLSWSNASSFFWCKVSVSAKVSPRWGCCCWKQSRNETVFYIQYIKLYFVLASDSRLSVTVSISLSVCQYNYYYYSPHCLGCQMQFSPMLLKDWENRASENQMEKPLLGHKNWTKVWNPCNTRLVCAW